MKARFLLLTATSVLLLNYCLANPQAERFDLNRHVGKITVDGVKIQVLTAPVSYSSGKIRARAQTPTLEIRFHSGSPDPVNLSFELANQRHDQLPLASEGVLSAGHKPGIVIFDITINPEESKTVFIENYPATTSYRFGIVGDLQFEDKAARKIAASAATRDLDFFIVVGDFVNQPTREEYNWAVAIAEQFGGPVYPAFGNHDGFNNGYSRYYRQMFGTTNYFFKHQGDLFLFLDSADQSISREVFNYADSVLSESNARARFVFLHVAPFDAAGMRNNSFNSRFQAARFMNMLQDNRVDIIFAGHTHTYQDFKVDTVRNIIVGTGGGTPELFDGVELRYAIVHGSGNGHFTVEPVDVK